MAGIPRTTAKRPKEPTIGALKAQLQQSRDYGSMLSADCRELKDKLARAEVTIEALAAALVLERRRNNIPF